MNVFILTATIVLALPAVAQTADGAKYARCAGSSEVHKCRALVDAIANETPEAKRARVEKLERDRIAAAQEVAKQPLTYRPPAQRTIISEPAIGMSEYEVTNTQWGNPESKNRTVTQSGSRDQWVYGDGRYVYLTNGRVTAISSRH